MEVNIALLTLSRAGGQTVIWNLEVLKWISSENLFLSGGFLHCLNVYKGQRKISLFTGLPYLIALLFIPDTQMVICHISYLKLWGLIYKMILQFKLECSSSKINNNTTRGRKVSILRSKLIKVGNRFWCVKSVKHLWLIWRHDKKIIIIILRQECVKERCRAAKQENWFIRAPIVVQKTSRQMVWLCFCVSHLGILIPSGLIRRTKKQK